MVMEFEHPFFQRSAAARSVGSIWSQIGAGWAEDTHEILSTALKYREELPGGAFFHVPDYAQEHPAWSDLLVQTMPYCECENRRIMWPGRGRSKFLPDGQTIVLKQGQRTPTFAFVPNGGDLHAAYALLSYEYNDVKLRQRPFMGDNRRDVRLIYTHQLTGSAEAYPDLWVASSFMVDDYLRRNGSVDFMLRMPGPINREDYPGCLPLCTLTDFRYGDRDAANIATFTVDPSVSVIQVDDWRTVKDHTCN
jgi:hypothetical protein